MGSSPLTRGKRSVVLLGGFAVGLIPAHAGKTNIDVIAYIFNGAHPRSRGENVAAGQDRLVLIGSSPLTRGKLICQSNLASRSGLIPAHAGKTAVGISCELTQRAHPRSRGENG